MKIELFNWAGDRKAAEALTKCGYEHRQIIERTHSVADVVEELLATGINVMVLHGKSTVDYIVAVDSRSFGQR